MDSTKREKLEEIFVYLRKRLAEYKIGLLSRNKQWGGYVNAIEICLCLVDYWRIYDRKLKDEDEGWFNAHWPIMQAFEETSNEDLYTYYSQLTSMVQSDGEMWEDGKPRESKAYV